MDVLKKYFPGLSDEKLDRFERFAELFLEWNQKINLISRKDEANFKYHHLLHSLAIAKFIEFQPGAGIMDVGTGGGLPGLPLAIYFPEVQFTLVDSIAKKIKVVNDIAQQLELKNVQAYQERMENITEKFDFITSRAVAPTAKLDQWLQGKIKQEQQHAIPNGYLFLKGGDLTQELQQSGLEYEQKNLSEDFQEEFFKTKHLIYIPKV